MLSSVFPASVDSERVEANLENGVLTVALPKAEKGKARTIQVQSEKTGLLGK